MIKAVEKCYLAIGTTVRKKEWEGWTGMASGEFGVGQ